MSRPRDERQDDLNYLKGRIGDRINPVLAAAGYNFGLLRLWFAGARPASARLNQRHETSFTDDY